MTDAEIFNAVEKVFETDINPALAGHGGGAKIVTVKESRVYVELQGGCRGCMGARMTMKNGIERLLKEKVPAVLEVIDATNHG
ncbi:MAG: NifU family protein [Pontiellaceae bacterium]|jgi:Fe/S biogenesis protein NfuA|nr:NifU family protein [Pontiellaceae bacterium]